MYLFGIIEFNSIYGRIPFVTWYQSTQDTLAVFPCRSHLHLHYRILQLFSLTYSRSSPFIDPFIDIMVTSYVGAFSLKSSPNENIYGITEIKSYVQLLLDLHHLNYESWKELFQTHYIRHKVFCLS